MLFQSFQGFPKFIPTDRKTAYINRLIKSGVRRIDFGSFVSPKAVPQMAGTGDLARALAATADAELSALVPNMKGYELARDAGVETVAVVVSATETMNQRNINMSLADTVAVALDVIARESGTRADLVLLGLTAATGEDVRRHIGAIDGLLSRLPTTVLVASNGEADMFV